MSLHTYHRDRLELIDPSTARFEPGCWVKLESLGFEGDWGMGVVVAVTGDDVAVLWSVTPWQGSVGAVGMPIVRRSRSGFVLNGLVSIQPMTGPVGGIFYKDYTYGSSVPKDAACTPASEVVPSAGEDRSELVDAAIEGMRCPR